MTRKEYALERMKDVTLPWEDGMIYGVRCGDFDTVEELRIVLGYTLACMDAKQREADRDFNAMANLVSARLGRR